MRAVVDNLQEELSGFFVCLHLDVSGNAVRALAACVNRILKRVGEQHAQVALGKRQLIGQHGMHRKRDALRLARSANDERIRFAASFRSKRSRGWLRFPR